MVTRVLNFVYKEVRGLHQAAYVLAVFAFASQLLAIVRDRLLAHTFGAGAELDVYYAAFRIPDLLFVLFASALSVYVLLPFVAQRSEVNGDKAGAEVLSQMFSLFLVVYSAIALVLVVTASWYVPYLFPGFAEESAQLTILMQILLLQPFLLGVSSLCAVVTQMSHRFILYAISPLLYNVGIILGIGLLYPFFGITGLVYGVVLGALGHLVVQLPYVFKSSLTFSLAWKFDWKLISRILSVAIPRALTLSAHQLVLLVLVGMATVMAAGSVSVFQFALNLQSVPLAIVGMSYSVAAFPTLSSLYAKKDHQGFNLQLLTAFRHIIFWSIPIITLVIVLRAQIVRVLLGSGEFDWGDTRLTAAVLAIFIISLCAQAILLLLTRAFYACGGTYTPLFIAIISGLGSIGLAVWLEAIYAATPAWRELVETVFRLSNVAGTEVLVLVMAFTIGQFIQLFLLMIFSVKLFNINYALLWRLLWQSLTASISGAIVAYGTLAFIVDGVNQETFLGITIQGVSAGLAGVVTVVLVYHLCRSIELKEVSKSFHSKFSKVDEIVAQQETL